ncbi:sensor histidine kinase [Eisenibacter elegans]|uniref:sensor histidine kinase n=1 Tax=Eisenibacter elegans TaxID=997 RepID=UPI0003FEFD23|nr:sensor histidine kinase [Eisenibacter elegans]
MATWLIALLSFGYLLLLFAVAYWGEWRARQGRSLLNRSYMYALSLAVYCTAWTYYGSVGRAAEGGLTFLTTYIGPTLAMPLWWMVMHKIVRISKVRHINTLADFVSARYGKSVSIGALVTLICAFGITPYIALQIKAISNSFLILTEGVVEAAAAGQQVALLEDTAFYLTLGLALFIILFGTTNISNDERHEGMVTAIVFESIIKLVAFVLVGIFVTYGLFGGWQPLFKQAAEIPELAQNFTFRTEEHLEWFFLNLAAAMAVWFLPRQFQVAVVENTQERHLKRAVWLFPLYLLVINLFVLPIAFGGRLFFGAGSPVDADTYVLSIPQAAGYPALALFAYVGGFSAATSMIIVSTISLSTMLSNNLIMPILVSKVVLPKQDSRRWRTVLIYTRRLSVLVVLLLAYLYFELVGKDFSLVSIGLISFVAVSQFAPAVIGGIYWKQGTRVGASLGLLIGIGIWAWVLVLPTLVSPEALVLFSWLRPESFTGLAGLSSISSALFWSLSGNVLGYYVGSVLSRQGRKERHEAELFVNIYKYSTSYEQSVIWKAKAYMPDLRSLLSNFLGDERANQLLESFAQQHNIDLESAPVDTRLISYAEKILAGTIGAASARIMINSVVDEADIGRAEIVDILKESQQLVYLNRELSRKSKALEVASQELQRNDRLKNEFISTVTHELKTPITSIRAFSEILHDNPDLEEDEKKQFLHTIIKETERMERLILSVLDLERFESGKQLLHFQTIQLNDLIRESAASMRQVFQEKGVQLLMHLDPNLPRIEADADRMQQVILNLLSNALKFCPAVRGRVIIYATYDLINRHVQIDIEDNGKGIPEGSKELIFDKFFQVENQTIRKPQGSGLGLAICRNIITHHKGKIWVQVSQPGRTVLSFRLPFSPQKKEPKPADSVE